MTARTAGIVVLCVGLGTIPALAQDSQAVGGVPGTAVSVEAQKLKDAADIDPSALDLRPIALDSLPAPIDPAAVTGQDVSAIARSLRTLDPADIPGTARTLGSTAQGHLPGAASSRNTGGHSPTLPSAAQGRSRGRGPR